MSSSFILTSMVAMATGFAPVDVAAMSDPASPFPVPVLAAADCGSAAQKVTSQTGGQLLSAKAGSRDGQPVCTITVLVPAKGSERPRKVTVSVPQ